MKRQRFECKRDDKIIRGTVFRPGEGQLPAVILSHGFMANEKTCYQYAKVLAGLGYAAFTFDFCGGGIQSRSDGKSSEMTLLTELEDLEAVLSFVKEFPCIDAGNISLLGCSQGGFVSALAAKNHPEIRNLILFYPALCIPDDARNGKMLGFHFDPDNMPDILSSFPMRIGKCYAATVIDWDFREKIRGYSGKTILIHGTEDPIVNIRYAREAAGCYPNCCYHEIEGGGHGFRGKHDREAISVLQDEMKLA